MTQRLGSDVTPIEAGEEFRPDVVVDRADLPIAIRHGMELWWDGSTPTKRLDTRDGDEGFSRFVNARVEGKLAEVAFKKLLAQYFGVESAVDWRIYGEYTETDDGDLQYIVGDDGGEYPPSVPFDVKKTKPWNSWLAIRSSIYDKLEPDAPIVLTKLSLQDDLELDDWEDTDDWEAVDTDETFRQRLMAFADDYFPLTVEFSGTAYKDEFTDEFDQGEKLYDPTTGATLGGPLRCDNRGIHVNDLYNSPERWNSVILDITQDLPVEVSPLYVVDE